MSNQQRARLQDTSHLAPTNFEFGLYMWSRPVARAFRRYVMDIHWGYEPPDVRLVQFRASGRMGRRSRVFVVHLVVSLEVVPLPTLSWSELGALARAIRTTLETNHDLTCPTIDRTVIDIEYIATKS